MELLDTCNELAKLSATLCVMFATLEQYFLDASTPPEFDVSPISVNPAAEAANGASSIVVVAIFFNMQSLFHCQFDGF
jgi:hypothetical protein